MSIWPEFRSLQWVHNKSATEKKNGSRAYSHFLTYVGALLTQSLKPRKINSLNLL